MTENPGKQNSILDSGSTSHIANNKRLFSKINKKSTVTIANDNKLTAFGSREALINTKTPDGETKIIKLQEVLFIPEIESNLISVSKATKNGAN